MQNVGAWGGAWLMVPPRSTPGLFMCAPDSRLAAFRCIFFSAWPFQRASRLADIVDPPQSLNSFSPGVVDEWASAVLRRAILDHRSNTVCRGYSLVLTICASPRRETHFEAPGVGRAILPALVPKEEPGSGFSQAPSKRNWEFNLSASVGPALGGGPPRRDHICFWPVVRPKPSSAKLSFLSVSSGVFLVVCHVKRLVRRRSAPPELFSGATVCRQFRYVRALLSRNPYGIAL